MSLTLRLISLLHHIALNSRTMEPRRGMFFLLYYGIGALAALIVFAMVLLCLEAYNLAFARDFLYRQLGQHILVVLESWLF